MLFNSYTFLFVFLPVTLAVFHLLDRGGWQRASRFWLVCASVFFYGSGEAEFLWLLTASIVINYTFGQRLQSLNQNPARSRLLLIAGVVLNLCALAWFKYRGFLGEIGGSLLGRDLALGEVILPLAISFFTFQQIAYLVDSARGQVRSSGFLSYCLFVTFFPQLIAGPIVHHSEMLPQFDRNRWSLPRWDHLSIGVTVFVIGLFKKVVIADTVAGYATPVFDAADAGAAPSFYAAWAATAAYSFQIYFDFSGYSDMAIGLGHMFGIRLPDNFLSPYKAVNIVDFWRRWHITLSRFLRDYLYIPLGGNRHGSLMRYRNLMLTMLLGGLWHGAAWTFVVWGALHGVYLAVNHLWQSGARTSDSPSMLRVWLSRALTLYLVAIAWVFFRAHTFTGAADILLSMHGFSGFSLLAPFSRIESAILLVALLMAVWLLPNTSELVGDEIARRQQDAEPLGGGIRWQPSAAWGAAVSGLAVSAIVMISRGGEFIYYHF